LSRDITIPMTATEAANVLRKSKRWLLEWLRKHPADQEGEPYYTPIGRDKIFHQADIARIEWALREGVKCRSNSGRRALVKRRTMKSGARTSESEWRLAAELLNDPSLSPNLSGSKSASRSMVNTRPPNSRLAPTNQRS
jgi:hypothetical protein